MAFLLRPGKTPSGVEIRGHLRRLIQRIRRHWPHTRITIRGDAEDWLMLTVRDAIPKAEKLAGCAFTTLRMRLIKITARITQTATRVRIAFASACPETILFRTIARGVQIAGP